MAGDLCKCGWNASFPRSVLFCLVALCGAWLRGFELGVTLPFAERYLASLHAPPELHGVLVTLLLGGSMVAELTVSFAAGVWADTVVETRPIVILSAVPQALGGILYFFAETPSQLVLSRVISGLGAGAATAVTTELVRAAPVLLRTAGLAGLAVARLMGVALGPWAGARLEDFPDIFKHRVTSENAAGLVLLLAYLGYMLMVAVFYPNLTAEQIADSVRRGTDEVDTNGSEVRTENVPLAPPPVNFERASPASQVACKTPPNSESGGPGETTTQRRARLFIPLPNPATQRPDIQASSGWFTPVETAERSGWFTPDEEKVVADSECSPTVSKLVAQYEKAPKAADSLQRPAPGKDNVAPPSRKRRRDVSPNEQSGDSETENLTNKMAVASSLPDDMELPFAPKSTSTRPPSAASGIAETSGVSTSATQQTAPSAENVEEPSRRDAALEHSGTGHDATDRPLEGPYSAPLSVPLPQLRESLQEVVPSGVLASPRHQRLRVLLARWRHVLSGPAALILLAGASGQLAHTSLQLSAEEVMSPPLVPEIGWLLTADAMAQTPVLLLLLLAPLLHGTGGGPLLTISSLLLSAVGHFGLATSVSELHHLGPTPSPAPDPTNTSASDVNDVAWCAVVRGSAALQCCGYALLEPAAVTLLVSVSPMTLYGRALAYWRMAAGAGLVLGLIWSGSLTTRALALLLGPVVLLSMVTCSVILAYSRGVFSTRRDQVDLVNLLGPHLPVEPATLRMRTVSVINHLHSLYRGIVSGPGGDGASVVHATSQTDPVDTADVGGTSDAAPGGVRFMIGGAVVGEQRERRDTVVDMGDNQEQPLLAAEQQAAVETP